MSEKNIMENNFNLMTANGAESGHSDSSVKNKKNISAKPKAKKSNNKYSAKTVNKNTKANNSKKQSKIKVKVKNSSSNSKKDSGDNISFGNIAGNMMDMMSNFNKNFGNLNANLDQDGMMNNYKKYFDSSSINEIFEAVKHPGFNTSAIGRDSIDSLFKEFNNVLFNSIGRAQGLLHNSCDCLKEQYESSLLGSDPMERSKAMWEYSSSQTNKISSFFDESMSDMHKLQMCVLASFVNGLPHQQSNQNMRNNVGSSKGKNSNKK